MKKPDANQLYLATASILGQPPGEISGETLRNLELPAVSIFPEQP